MATRFQTLGRQASLGDQLKRECKRRGVTVVAVERAMGLAPTALNHYLRASRPWPHGLEDFQRRVLEGIQKAIAERERGAA